MATYVVHETRYPRVDSRPKQDMWTDMPRVIVAKYISDLRRLEPRNIGVLIWNEGRIETRFLGLTANETIVPPHFVRRHKQLYQNWVASWLFQCDQDRLRDHQTGAMVARTSGRFVDVLQQQSTAHFHLVESTAFAEKTNAIGWAGAANILFGKLVEEEPCRANSVKALSIRLRQLASEVFAGSRLMCRKYQRPKTNLLGKLVGVYKHFEVDYAFGVNGKTTTVFRCVLPGRGNSANLAAVTFGALKEWDMRGARYKCCSLCIDGTSSTEKVQRDMQLLHRISDAVIDVSNPEQARAEVEAAVGLTEAKRRHSRNPQRVA